MPVSLGGCTHTSEPACAQGLPKSHAHPGPATTHDTDLASPHLPWPPTVLTAASILLIQDILRKRLSTAVAAGHRALVKRMQAFHIVPPTSPVSHGNRDTLDLDWPRALTLLAQRAQLSPAQLIELVRGQTACDYRPNKALYPEDISLLFHGYPHLTDMLSIAAEGFRIPRREPLPTQTSPPPNHGSARKHDSTLMRLMRGGQADHQYVFLMVSVLSQWPNEIFFSPLGLVPKGKQPMSVIARVIQDLSFPIGLSVNDCTDKSLLPLVAWPKIVELALRITDLHASHPPGTLFKGMTGDVAQAYRNLRAHAADCTAFGISLPQHAVIGMDMSAPFGWNGSPNMYCVFGNGITWLVGRESPASINPTMSCDARPFWCYNYMDDCIILEVDEGYRLSFACIALKLAMIATLGPEAMNLQKFQPWQSVFIALGLRWDLTRATVSMPQDKIDKAQERLLAIHRRRTASRTELEKLLGSLRHVASCFRPARAFYQTLHRTYRSFPTFGHRPLSRAALADIDCFKTLLQVAHLVDIPTAVFDMSSEPTVVLQMDASDEALAIIDVARRRYIQVTFDAAERFMIAAVASSSRDMAIPKIANRYPDMETVDEFSINVREYLAIVFAILLWGPSLADLSQRHTVHIGVLSDNTSAISWTNNLSSPNRFGQNLSRHLAVTCVRYRLEVSARHILGRDNVLPDAGPRPSSPELQQLWVASTRS